MRPFRPQALPRCAAFSAPPGTAPRARALRIGAQALPKGASICWPDPEFGDTVVKVLGPEGEEDLADDEEGADASLTGA